MGDQALLYGRIQESWEGTDDSDWPEFFAEKFETMVLKSLIWTLAILHFESSYFPMRGYLYRVNDESQREQCDALSHCRYGERSIAEARWTRVDGVDHKTG